MGHWPCLAALPQSTGGPPTSLRLIECTFLLTRAPRQPCSLAYSMGPPEDLTNPTSPDPALFSCPVFFNTGLSFLEAPLFAPPLHPRRGSPTKNTTGATFLLDGSASLPLFGCFHTSSSKVQRACWRPSRTPLATGIFAADDERSPTLEAGPLYPLPLLCGI